MPRYGQRSFTGNRSLHSTGDADGCSAHTCWAGIDSDACRCCAISTEATAKAVSNWWVHRTTGAVWRQRISVNWNYSTALGRQQKTTPGLKHASKKSNSMSTTTPKRPRYPTQKVQNSSLARFAIVPSSRGLVLKWAEVMVAARRVGRRLETADAWIASTAIMYDAPLITHNGSDYSGVPGLKVITEVSQ